MILHNLGFECKRSGPLSHSLPPRRLHGTDIQLTKMKMQGCSSSCNAKHDAQEHDGSFHTIVLFAGCLGGMGVCARACVCVWINRRHMCALPPGETRTLTRRHEHSHVCPGACVRACVRVGGWVGICVGVCACGHQRI